ncbi:hypothetical protein THAOC_31540 [Thalassiosira oceanica]|uniref:Uncharacterized protein n=1 Tax=Thalassiosira oceanica TaxID=159749 RepID=K0RB77_THAOC|nr:hypothetical protein THAOC_31540 [Thalassiosira oceanica]|eukprot:EJK49564.1 hypothetical protein THAOC_31540 [Thalassiosira oceanica]
MPQGAGLALHIRLGRTPCVPSRTSSTGRVQLENSPTCGRGNLRSLTQNFYPLSECSWRTVRLAAGTTYAVRLKTSIRCQSAAGDQSNLRQGQPTQFDSKHPLVRGGPLTVHARKVISHDRGSLTPSGLALHQPIRSYCLTAEAAHMS